MADDSKPMRICYFGTYDGTRPRNRILMEALRKVGVQVMECHFSPWGGVEDKSQMGFVRRLWAALLFVWGYLRLTVRYLAFPAHDAMVVGYLGHFDMFLARPLASLRRKPLIFDAFLSLYNTVIEDRKLFRPGSLPAGVLFRIDRTACRMADRILLDTEAHIDYFVKTFRLPREKFRRVFVGAEGDLFYPCETREYATDLLAARRLKPAAASSPEHGILDAESCFHVLFYGQFIPLHGIETIVRAAKVLEEEEVAFTLIGKGQESEKIRRLVKELGLTRIRWEEWVPYRDLRDYICGTDAGLGIFGETEKASQVIPNKAFQIIACRRPLITGDTPAARELFADGESAVLCKMADPVSLARGILRLKHDPELRRRVADGGYRVFQDRCPLDPEIFSFPHQKR